jgi:predicted ATPase/class 3 adenylate cyclase
MVYCTAEASGEGLMVELPTGTVTFLFTDVEGSTRLWEEHPLAMRAALARHDEIIRNAIVARGGRVVKTTGDGFHAAFDTADAAALAALDAQAQLTAERWAEVNIAVRMSLHTGTAEQRDGDYYGSVLNRAARLMSAAHGGQVLVSGVAEQLIRDVIPREVALVDLGEHRLRDLAAPMHVFQLSDPAAVLQFPPLRSLDWAAGNLPALRSSFVGRERELRLTRELLKDRRLITLTGVGGVGKTRLALQAAADALASFAGGVWLVELARTSDPESVASLVGRSLGASPHAGRLDVDVVCDYLGTAHAVVVLDNCEHVIRATAALTESLLDQCPNVVVLATSREPLNVSGEQLVPVRPLDPATDAVALFAERGRLVDPEFELTRDAEIAVSEICRRLDGLPLAVELAAARVDTTAVRDIAARLDDRFRLLSSEHHGVADRHQTLRAALEWSYQLLDDNERCLFRRLGIFASGFPGDAVQPVCTFEHESLATEDVVRSLVRKSLVQFEREPGPGRYRLLETVRVFALEQLTAADESELAGRAHAEWIATLVDYPLERWYTEGEVDLPAVRRELDNWREAVTFALTRADADLALRLTFHTLGAENPETAGWSEAALALPGVSQLSGSHWLHWTVLTRAAAKVDLPALEHHVAAFEARCVDERELAWLGGFEAIIALANGDDALEAIERRLSIPGLSPRALADLHMYRSLYRNMTPNVDVEAARLAVRVGADARYVALPMSLVSLAVALSRQDPTASMAALRQAEDLAEAGGNTFIIASVAAWGAPAILSLPDNAVARELLARLDRLQPYWNNAAVALLTLCVSVLRRVNDPIAAPLHAYVSTAPGSDVFSRTIAPDLPQADLSVTPLASYDEAVELTRTSLHNLAGNTIA